MPDAAASGRRIRIYSLSTCPVCGKVKRFLDEKGITYEDVVVDLLDGGEQWVTSKELKRYNPAGSYPTVVVEQVVVGFDEGALRKTLGIP